MRYNWEKVYKELRKMFGETVTFRKADGTVDTRWAGKFQDTLQHTDNFHVWADNVTKVLLAIPERPNYYSCRSLQYWRKTRYMLIDEVYEYICEMQENARDYYTTKWNFAPGVQLPHAIECKEELHTDEQILRRIMRAARSK